MPKCDETTSLLRNFTNFTSQHADSTLRTPKEDGLVTRRVCAEVPPRVEYSISDRTRTLLPHINSLIGWAKDNMTAILSDRASCK